MSAFEAQGTGERGVVIDSCLASATHQNYTTMARKNERVSLQGIKGLQDLASSLKQDSPLSRDVVKDNKMGQLTGS